MGKRTKAKTGKTHALRPRDYWPTIDHRCIPPLVGHLPASTRYAEPMAGNRSLIGLIGDHATCVWASDLKPDAEGVIEQDVFEWDGTCAADVNISNPPWTRAILHRIIVHLSDIRPTWLLFDADWANTDQSLAFAPRLRKIVMTGRLVWVPGTTNGGFTACAWYLFDKPRAGNVPLLFPHHYPPPENLRRTPRICTDCGVLIDRFAKWHLQMRSGVPAPVHKDCAHPSGIVAETPAPLLDWFAGKETCP